MMILNLKKKCSWCAFFLLVAIVGLSCNPKSLNGTSSPKIDGCVPNKETAIKIAEAVWLPIFGDDVLDEKPYVAALQGNIWIVEGTLYATHGGVAFIKLQKSDGKILDVGHGK